MKSINRDNLDAQLTGAVTTKKLKIASNWKMFKELISGIYSDKAYAIARETFANGIDSHTAAGCPERPIVVHVPSVFEPFYSIRDFGTSMNRELMETVYCTLGESTKDDPNSEDSNRYVGKFGLGSKSPFAYTDSFQVTAFYDGKAHMYDIFKGVEGPEMALLAVEDSDEEQGILVSFGVDPKDIHDFVRAIKRATEGLDVTPIFLGEIALHQRTVKYEGEGWRLLDGTQSGAAEARQGTVLYPLNFQAVINCPAELKSLFNQPFRFDFDIGQLDIVTSREALSYDEETSQNIIDRLITVQKEIMSRIENDISGAATYWEFCRAYKKAMDAFPEDKFGKLLAEKPKFLGREPRSEITVSTADVRKSVAKTEIDPTSGVAKSVTTHTHEFRFGRVTYAKLEPREWGNVVSFREDRDRRSNKLTLSTERNIIVVTEDMREKNRYPAARIRKLLDKLVDDMVYTERMNSTLLWLRHEGNADYVFKRLFTAFGRPNMTVFNLLDVEHIVAPRQYQTGPRMPFKSLKKGSWITPDEGTPLPTEAYWVPLRNGDVDFGDGPQFGSEFMSDILPVLVAYGAEDLPIIGIPASTRKLIANNPDWQEFYPFVKKVAPDMFDEAAYRRVLGAKKTYFRTPDFANLLEEMYEVEHLRPLFKDAFAGTDVEKIMDAIIPVEELEGDALSETIRDILMRFEQRRVSEAEKSNAALRRELLGAGEDPEAGIYQSEANVWVKLKNDIEAEFVAKGEGLGEMAEGVMERFPLFQFMTYSSLRYKDHALREVAFTEVLNYVFNKRLMEDELVKDDVDTSVAA